MKRNLFTILFSLFVIGCFIQSCGESDCSLSTVSYARFDFLDSKTHQSVKLTNGATIAGIIHSGDSLLIDTVFNQAQQYMSVPLSYTNQTTYVMHYSETLRDTIRLTHKNIPFVSDIECGSVMFYQIENMSYTTNVLDSVVLVNPDINNEEKKNFNIYYRTADDE
ncbi:MAG: hypothetical protein J6B31_01900 [Bacteroidaceae bacterium]|nr:hypothetical protein [Bacteroidaceae bacterium]MBQ8889613.1 hypothetical protein [Bacteroidaceae bacterium]